jgi:hypothetical protein
VLDCGATVWVGTWISSLIYCWFVLDGMVDFVSNDSVNFGALRIIQDLYIMRGWS